MEKLLDAIINTMYKNELGNLKDSIESIHYIGYGNKAQIDLRNGKKFTIELENIDN